MRLRGEAASGEWTLMLRSYLQRRLLELGNAIGTSTTERTTNGDGEQPFGLTRDQQKILRRNMTNDELYHVRSLYLQRMQLDRDLCATELEIRSYMDEMSMKYLARPAELGLEGVNTYADTRG